MKILIGCPTCDLYEPLLNEYLACVEALEHPDFDIDLLLVDNSKDDRYLEKLKSKGINAVKGPWAEGGKERIVLSREILRKKCLEEGYDFMFSLEQDVMAKPDTLRRLLSHKKNIISAYYGQNKLLTVRDSRTGEVKKAIINLPVAYLQTRPGFIKQANAHEVIRKGLIEIGAAGLGCMLISREALNKVPFRVNPDNGFDDVLFCKEAKSHGYKIHFDGDIILEHRHREWEKMGVKK